MPILGYNINITNRDTNSTENIFTYDTKLIILLDHDYMVSAAAVNIVGEGNKTVFFVNSTKLTNNSKYIAMHCVYSSSSFAFILSANSYLVVIAELETNG